MPVTIDTVHTTTIVGQCPHGGIDVYVAEFHVSDHTITVESIQIAIDALVHVPIYQEALTHSLAANLGCSVVTTGCHGRFKTVCRAISNK